MGPQTKDRGKTAPAVMCIKVLLHVFNLIYLIIGASVLGIGVWIQIQLKSFMQLTELYYDNSPWIMIGVGALIILVALGGFCCTAKDKVALLYMYGVFITVLAILQVAAGIAGAVFSKTIDTDIVKGLYKTIGDPNQQTEWDEMQKTLGCCGVEHPNDLVNNGTRGKIPDFCYKSGPTTVTTPSTAGTSTTPAAVTTTQTVSTTAGKPTSPPAAAANATEGSATANSPSGTTATSIKLESTTEEITSPSNEPPKPARKKRQTSDSPGTPLPGCHAMISEKVQQYMSIIVGVCVGFVVLQIIGAILACVLAKKTSKNNYEQIY